MKKKFSTEIILEKAKQKNGAPNRQKPPENTPFRKNFNIFTEQALLHILDFEGITLKPSGKRNCASETTIFNLTNTHRPTYG